MKAVALIARTALLLAALVLLTTGLLPADLAAEDGSGPCPDEGCPGGEYYCSYVISGEELMPCFTPSLEAE